MAPGRLVLRLKPPLSGHRGLRELEQALELATVAAGLPLWECDGDEECGGEPLLAYDGALVNGGESVLAGDGVPCCDVGVCAPPFELPQTTVPRKDDHQTLLLLEAS